MRRTICLISMLVLLVAAIPAAATPIYSSGSYNVSGNLGSQGFWGSIAWSGSAVTSYNLNFGGQNFACSSPWGGCSLVFKTFNFSGYSGLLAGVFSPGGSPFTFITNGYGNHQKYWSNVTWTASMPEESALMQVGALLGLFLLVIPRARLLARKA